MKCHRRTCWREERHNAFSNRSLKLVSTISSGNTRGLVSKVYAAFRQLSILQADSPHTGCHRIEIVTISGITYCF